MTTCNVLKHCDTYKNKCSSCPKWKINYFWCPKIKNLYHLVIMFLNIRTPKIINFPFQTNRKLMFYGIPILKHLRVIFDSLAENQKHFTFDYFPHLLLTAIKLPTQRALWTLSKNAKKSLAIVVWMTCDFTSFSAAFQSQTM